MSQFQGNTPTFAIQQSGTTPEPPAQVAITPTGSEQPPAGVAPPRNNYAGGKYKSVEELEKGYSELQAKFSQKFPDTTTLDVNGILGRAGLKNEDIVTNWSAEGKLNDQQYAKFAAIGYSRSVVDTFLHGQQIASQEGGREQQEMMLDAYEMAGGKEQLHNLLTWAQTQYQPEKIDEINNRLGTRSGYQGAMKELLFDYRQAIGAGFTRPMASGQAMPNVSSGFTSVKELVTAMREARESGRFDEVLKRRLANTPQNILEGVESR